MKLQQALCFCTLLATAWAVIDPRGARPVEHGYKADKCATEKDWPFCTDDDWGPKCPSGCRIQGLLDKTDHDILTRIDKIRKLLDENRQKYRSTDQSSKQTYDYLRDRLTTNSGNENKYMSLAESLRQRIVEVKIKIERQLNILEALKARVKEQVIEMQRLETDIDIKLRACKGSCAEYAEFTADRESYVALDKQLDQLESIRVNSVETVGALRVMKSRPLKEVVVPSIYKSGLPGSEAEEQKQYFGEVGQSELTLQAEGATADAPATVKCQALRVDPVPLRPSYRSRPRPRSRSRPGSARYGQCPAKPSFPLCSDDQWIEKCPSGCRLEGLISAAETDFHRRLGQVCSRAQTYQNAISSAMLLTTAIYSAHRKIIVKHHVAELRSAERFEELQRNLTLLQRRSTELSRKLQNIHGLVLQHITDMQRLEVDIDIKLRACHGSCKHTFVHHIDHQAYSDMRSSLATFNPLTVKKAKFPADIRKLVLQPVLRPPVSLTYRNIPIVRKEFLTQFEDIDLNQVILEELFNEFDLED